MEMTLPLDHGADLTMFDQKDIDWLDRDQRREFLDDTRRAWFAAGFAYCMAVVLVAIIASAVFVICTRTGAK